MAGKKTSRSSAAAISAGRILGGIIILYLGFSGARSVLLVDKDHLIGIIYTIMGIPISIMFLLLGFVMVFAGVPERKKRRKVSQKKLDNGRKR